MQIKGKVMWVVTDEDVMTPEFEDAVTQKRAIVETGFASMREAKRSHPETEYRAVFHVERGGSRWQMVVNLCEVLWWGLTS